MDRVFLDANVLFSAGYSSDSRLRELWSLRDAELVTSELALEEARRNLVVYSAEGLPVLEDLSRRMTVVAAVHAGVTLPRGLGLADKDRPMLSAAIAASCTHLLTGDKRHFGSLYGRRIRGVLILTPGQYLRRRKRRD